jgi:hypothetical protein
MNIAYRSNILLLLTICALPFAVRAQGLPTIIDADLNHDGRIERVTLDDKSDPALSVSRGRKTLWRGVHARWQPWKLLIADVDGDGRREIVVGIRKATRYFPKPHNCLFIYSWSGRRAFPKWLGSTLSKPFTDFAFSDLDKDGEDELIAIETMRDGKLCVAIYKWNGFGFTLDRQRGAWQSAKLLTDERGEIFVEADGARLALALIKED